MPRWLLIAVLYADGQKVREIAMQLRVSENTLKTYVQIAKGYLFGVTGRRLNGARVGHGTKLDLRAVLVQDGHLS